MDELANLNFLLAEMRRWRKAGRVPAALLDPLYDEYMARRAILLAPQPPTPASLGYDLAEEQPAPAKQLSLAAFLEKNNIAALHVVGGVLLFVGLIALVQWQWASWGRMLLPILLGGGAAGLMAGGDRLRKTEPQSGRVLGLLGAAIVPLAVVALQALRLTEGVLSWQGALALAGGIGALVSTVRWRLTRDPLLIPLFFAEAALLVGAGVPGFLGRELGWLALAGVALGWASKASQSERVAASGSGLGLTALALGGALLHGGDTPGGVALLGGALTLGFAAQVLRLGWLGYGASAFALLGAGWLAPRHGTLPLATALAGMGLVLATVSAWHRHTKLGETAPYRHGSWAGALLAAPLVAFDPDRPVWGLALGGIALLWLILARQEGDEAALYPALGVGLLALRLGAVPLDALLVRLTGIAPNPERWLLLPALLAPLPRPNGGESKPRNEAYASGEDPRPAPRRMAGVALAWACLGQFLLLWENKPEGAATLLLAAMGTALWSYFTHSRVAQGMVLVPLFAAALGLWLGRASGAWLLPPWTLGLAFIVSGVAWRQPADRPIRAILWCLAAGHLAAALLPPSWIDFWPLATLPVLLYLDRETKGDAPAAIGTAIFAVFLPLSVPEKLALGVVGGAFALTLGALSLRRERRLSLALAAGIASVAGVLVWGGFPRWSPSVAQTAFTVALVATLWQGLAGSFRRGPDWLWRTLSGVGLTVSGAAALLALLGAAEPGQGRWATLALAVTATTLSGAAGLRRELACLHAGFAAALAAFGLFLFDRIGLGPDRLDWFLLPLGVYLLLIAELRHQSALRLPGLLFVLAPSLLAAWLSPAQWAHSMLLAAACLACIALGIAKRVRAYLGGGIVFLVALLVVRLWEPLREINYGVYLTLLGVGTLAAAIAFERRREALLAWAQSVKETYEGWE